jgi:hypothetical protein
VLGGSRLSALRAAGLKASFIAHPLMARDNFSRAVFRDQR